MASENFLPKMARVTREFPKIGPIDPGAAVANEFKRLGLNGSLSGKRVGITAGSRGIHGIPRILRAVADETRAAGGEPVFLAAMGSHGGGTEAGQREILSSLGLTETALGAPVIPCAESAELGRTEGGLAAYALRSALSVDAIIAVNRVKPHTAFHGAVESGLHKMLVVGLGGPRGAAQFHSRGFRELPGLLLEVGALLLDRLPIAAGLAITEDAYDETASITGLRPEEFASGEARLLAEARAMMPSLPAQRLDALIVEEIGKNYSGTGMDTNVIGRLRIEGAPEPELPAIERIAALDLSEASHGNATGVGLADIVTDRLVSKIDLRATYLNCATTGFLMRAATPAHLPTEREALELLAKSLGERAADPASLRVLQIHDTLRLTEMLASEALLPELSAMSGVYITEAPREITFDQGGSLTRRLG